MRRTRGWPRAGNLCNSVHVIHWSLHGTFSACNSLYRRLNTASERDCCERVGCKRILRMFSLVLALQCSHCSLWSLYCCIGRSKRRATLIQQGVPKWSNVALAFGLPISDLFAQLISSWRIFSCTYSCQNVRPTVSKVIDTKRNCRATHEI